jgi:hypothetical protein
MVRVGLLLALLGLLLPAAAVFLLGAAAARMADQQPTLVVPVPEQRVEITLMPGARLRLSCVGASTWSARASDGHVLASSGSRERPIITGDIAPRRDDVFDVPPDGRVDITAQGANGGATVLLHDADTGPAPLAFAGAAAMFAAPLLAIGGSWLAIIAWWRHRPRRSRKRTPRRRRSASVH